jgi:hypothetical protein
LALKRAEALVRILQKAALFISLLDALRLFCGKSLQEIREISFEIGMLGQYGLDINDPQESHVLRALPGRTFSVLKLGCIMYAGFKRIEPGMDIGVDLGEEWGMAERRMGEEKGSSLFPVGNFRISTNNIHDSLSRQGSTKMVIDSDNWPQDLPSWDTHH